MKNCGPQRNFISRFHCILAARVIFLLRTVHLTVWSNRIVFWSNRNRIVSNDIWSPPYRNWIESNTIWSDSPGTTLHLSSGPWEKVNCRDWCWLALFLASDNPRLFPAWFVSFCMEPDTAVRGVYIGSSVFSLISGLYAVYSPTGSPLFASTFLYFHSRLFNWGNKWLGHLLLLTICSMMSWASLLSTLIFSVVAASLSLASNSSSRRRSNVSLSIFLSLVTAVWCALLLIAYFLVLRLVISSLAGSLTS